MLEIWTTTILLLQCMTPIRTTFVNPWTPTVDLVSISFYPTYVLIVTTWTRTALSSFWRAIICLNSGLCATYFSLFVLIHQVSHCDWYGRCGLTFVVLHTHQWEDSPMVFKILSPDHIPQNETHIIQAFAPSFPSFRSGIWHSIFHLKALCRKCSLPVVTSKTCLGATSPHSLRAYFLES